MLCIMNKNDRLYSKLGSFFSSNIENELNVHERIQDYFAIAYLNSVIILKKINKNVVRK